MKFFSNYTGVVFVLGIFITSIIWVYLARPGIESRIRREPELKEGYKYLIKGFLFWINLFFILFAVGIFSGVIFVWIIGWVLIALLFLYWIFFKEGAEKLAKHPGLPLIPQWSPKGIRFYVLGLVFWNLIGTYIFYSRISGQPILPDSSLWELPAWTEPYLFSSFIIGGFILISIIMAGFSGWYSMGKVYSANSRPTGKCFWLRTGSFSHGTNYKLNLYSDEYGLFLSVFFFFRIAHPPLFVPWSDIEVEHIPARFFPKVEFKFSQCPNVRFYISNYLAKELADASNGRFKL